MDLCLNLFAGKTSHSNGSLWTVGGTQPASFAGSRNGLSLLALRSFDNPYGIIGAEILTNSTPETVSLLN